MSESISNDQNQNNNNGNISNNKSIEQELVFILENGTEPIPVKAIKRPEPQLHSPIYVPFPPAINAADLIRTNKNGALLARCTNKFLIYRNEFAREARIQGYNLSMSEVSCLAAQAWKQEPNYVIRKYADISYEVKWLHKQLSRSRNMRRNSSSNLSSSVDDGEQTTYTTQQKRPNLLLAQHSPEMFRSDNSNNQQQNLMSSPLTPLTPTMFSPNFMYHPISGIVTSNIPLNTNNTTAMFSPRERFLNNSSNLEMIPSYQIPISYYNESFSMPSPRWVYGKQLSYSHSS